jgi:hypothetical protein
MTNRQNEANMTNVGQIERKTQDRIITLFQQQLGYRYLGTGAREKTTAISKPLFYKST